MLVRLQLTQEPAVSLLRQMILLLLQLVPVIILDVTILADNMLRIAVGMGLGELQVIIRIVQAKHLPWILPD